MGKHPAAADYIHLNGGSPLFDALADWMTKGYDAINRGDRRDTGPYSWRFWLRGAKKGILICGIVRDSSDRIGRPFPLLIMGEGGLKKWEKQWELLPVDLMKTWQRMETMAAQRYDDLGDMTEALRALLPPNGLTPPNQDQTVSPELRGAVEACRTDLQREGRAAITLHPSRENDALDMAQQSHLLLKRCLTEIPRAVFWGGTPAQTFMAVFGNALNTHDFVKLWSM